jgi:ABC-type branched-subunit amino acid transport system substrate-binding protein
LRASPLGQGLAVVALAALLASGCGGGEGVAENATVTVYVSAPLSGGQAAAGRAMCTGAKRELAQAGGRAGDVRVRAVCLDDTGGSRRWTLAALGANARQAVEDSTTVGYIGELDPAAAPFSRSILKEAGIAQLSDSSGAAAMSRLLDAVREAGSSESLRAAVYDYLSD